MSWSQDPHGSDDSGMESINPGAFAMVPVGIFPGGIASPHHQAIYAAAYQQALEKHQPPKRSMYEILAEQMSDPRFN